MLYSLLYILWNPSKIIFSIGGFTLRWYSVCWLLGLLLAVMLGSRLFARQGIDKETRLVNGKKTETDLFSPLFIYCFLGIIIGARLGHCLFYDPAYYFSSVQHIIEIVVPIQFTADGSWHFTGYAGLASHGGTLGLMIALAIYVRWSKIPLMTVLDNIAILTPITACFIRLGNLMNSEIIGKVTDVPWAFVFLQVDAYPRHPGQLYEALAYALLFFIGWYFYTRRPQRVGTGFFFGLCLTYIFTARFFIEFTKENQEAWEQALPLNMGQLLSLPFIALGVWCLWRAGKKLKG